MTSNYPFPNVSVRESVIGPIPFRSYWRNGIGIAAVFNRGPIGPITINTREDFAYLYGEDSSPGSSAVRQGLLQGATNFTLSRVMPSAKSSYGTIALQGSSPLTQEAFVGIGDSRTVGLKFEASYVSPSFRNEGSFLGDSLQSLDSSTLNFTAYEGYGIYDFSFSEKVDVSGISASPPITLENIAANTGVDDIQLITASGADGVLIRDLAKPGLAIRVDGSDSSGSIFAGAGSTDYLTVLTYAYESADNEFSILVKGQVTGGGASVVVNINASIPTGPDYFVIRYRYSIGYGSPLSDNVWSEKAFLPNTNVPALGFIVLNDNDRTQKDLFNITYDGTSYGEFDTGIDLQFGNPNGTTNLEYVIGSRFQVAISKSEVQIGENDDLAPNFPNTPKAFLESQGVLEILSLLRNAISSNVVFSGLFGDFEINQISLPYSFTFKSDIKGEAANRIKYKLSRTVGSGSPNDLLFGSAGAQYDVPQTMVGASNSMTIAERVLFDINGNPVALIQALSPGSSGNRLRITVRPQPPGRFTLDITDEGASIYGTPTASETLSLSNYSVDLQSGLYLASIDSKLVRVFFLPLRNDSTTPLTQELLNVTPQRLAPPIQTVTDIENPLHLAYRGVSYLKNFYLSGGTEPANYDPNNPAEEDVIDAIRRLESTDVAFLVLPGITASDSRYASAVSELILQAESSSTTNGLRLAIIQAPPRLTAGRTEAITAGITSNRCVVVAGYVGMPGTRQLGNNAIPADALYAAQLAVIPPHVSPAAVSGGRILQGVQSTDTPNNVQFLSAVTESRMEAIFFDPGLAIYKFLNGITASTDFNERYVSIRRTADQMIMDLYRNLQWVRSSPHTPGLRTRVASAVDAYMKSQVREERLLGFRPTICNESNNKISDISKGRLNILITYTPVFPADYISIDLVRDLSTEISLTTA